MAFLWGGNVDPNSQRSKHGAFGALADVGANAKAYGQSIGTRALSNLDDSTSYWRNLLSGNRQQVQQAAAPDINAALSANDAAKREEASKGTGRTGGTNAINQERGTNTQSQIDTLIGGVQPAAASALTSTGGNELSAMLQALGISSSSAGTLGYLSSADVNAAKGRQAQFVNTLVQALL